MFLRFGLKKVFTKEQLTKLSQKIEELNSATHREFLVKLDPIMVITQIKSGKTGR